MFIYKIHNCNLKHIQTRKMILNFNYFLTYFKLFNNDNNMPTFILNIDTKF